MRTSFQQYKYQNSKTLASSPGHSQILSRSRFSPRLRDKIWEWPGDGATKTQRLKEKI